MMKDKIISVKCEDLKIVLANQARLAQIKVDSCLTTINEYKDEIKRLQKMIKYHEKQLEESEITLLQANVALNNIKKVAESEDK